MVVNVYTDAWNLTDTPPAPGTDCGDAPESYGECCADVYGNNVLLGWCRDAESGQQPSIEADGDDLNESGIPYKCQYGSDDEDGIQLISDLVPGTEKTVNVSYPYDGGDLYVYLDVNQDGDFLDAGEMILSKSLSSGNQIPLHFLVPENTVPGDTYMRYILVPLGYQGGVGPVGHYSGGEVEDYKVTVKPPIAFEKRPTYRQNYQDHAGFLFIIRNDWEEPLTNVEFSDDLDNVLPGLTPGKVWQKGCSNFTLTWDPPFLIFSKASFSPGEYCQVHVDLNIPEDVEKGNYTNVTSPLLSDFGNIAPPASSNFLITYPRNESIIPIVNYMLGEDFLDEP
ncbi:MAG: hypothetical protein D3926_03565 [Desulfobacteraceae bacterium]|nr:MAG: hypothetical protein D3926_03565 [Desulfobacteraceae bacterium]